MAGSIRAIGADTMSIQVTVHTGRGDITIWCQNRLEFLAQREQAERRGYRVTVTTGMDYPDWLLKELVNENSHSTCITG